MFSSLQLRFDLTQGALCIVAPGMEELRLPLSRVSPTEGLHERLTLRICGTPVDGVSETALGDAWFTKLVGSPCRLLRSLKRKGAEGKRPGLSPMTDLAFANESQFLLLSEESIAHLNRAMESSPPPAIPEGAKGTPASGLSSAALTYKSFRPNLVVQGASRPFEENEWHSISLGDVNLDSTGPCERCSIINYNPETGGLDRRPLQVLAATNAGQGRGVLGQLYGFSQSTPAAAAAGTEAGKDPAGQLLNLRVGVVVLFRERE